ncbi:hypothetical protein AN394_00399 [Pseudoalteromonas sp. P1-26]|uniref:toll/interleukin-1 receptor domain-containing protein n=1 Tax=Pseudoalteromonas sp. P1-26 TaxID=1723759 RepID=UPI0006D65391|nr:toll/interleukin-1 receptor domain-containing protein [Pseudoalteromonas sp. P1-26]KPZ74682.1 hypothetical protein AN394_00399 [Pseudoalteromonas sp. P1-26]
MNGLEKVRLVEDISSELQAQMTFSDIENYFLIHGVPLEDTSSYSSKRVYSKKMLGQVSEELLFKIANEIGLKNLPRNIVNSSEVYIWEGGYFKLFLSHLSSFKNQTSNLQLALKKYAISGFVAHKNIEPTKEWLNEIEGALRNMDALVAILTPGFEESRWCDQEVGVAIGRDVLVIPIKKGLDPYGFIGKFQGIQAENKTVAQVANAIFEVLVKSPKTKYKILISLSEALSKAQSVEEVREKLSILNSLEGIPTDILEKLKLQILDNSWLMSSWEQIESINLMLSKNKINSIQLEK